ncbi:Uncharacterized protein TCM_010904 [Theobroma cacao]|uniref:Uncharacterized protein n=1 Tax=Theobroma cacao TaxID=3641 RepID=A0A061E7L5_THECC|nr:Uncharacterized protein TCM_010904 [Theobroma cacao]
MSFTMPSYHGSIDLHGCAIYGVNHFAHPICSVSRGDVRTRNVGIELGFWVSLGYLMQALALLTSYTGCHKLRSFA